jgi:hypothetical protein
MRCCFIRAAGTNSSGWAGGAVGSTHQDTTRLPRNTAFTGVTSTNGNHNHTVGIHQNRGGGGVTWDGGNAGGQATQTSTNGDHTHTVSINGGGDAETAPVHFSVNHYIKVN